MLPKRFIGFLILLFLLLWLHSGISKEIQKVYPDYKDYKAYVDAIILISIGYLCIESLADYFYEILKKKLDESAGQMAKAIVRIIGLGVLLASLTSIFKASASAALTLGSFFGLVFGMASQSILKHAAAGVIITLLRPIKPGERIKLVKQNIEGVVKEIRVFHIVLESEGKEILVPAGFFLDGIIEKFEG